MRYIGAIPDESLANRFGDYLLTLGIDSTVEPGKNGYALWVHHDDHLERAAAELKVFESLPADPRFDSAAAAARLRKTEAVAAKKRRENFQDVRTAWHRRAHRPTPLTVTLVMACGVVAAINFTLTQSTRGESQRGLTLMSPDGEPAARYLGFRDSRIHDDPGDLSATFASIRRGEVWRLITPIFLHLGLIHFAFNMLWLWQLAGAIEMRKGTLTLAALVVSVAVLSNVAEAIIQGVYFGGMSGVVYGLFGYVWMKGRLTPHDGVGIHKDTVTLMLAWLVICFTPLMPGVANAAHVAGLLVGVAIVWVPYQLKRLRRA